MLFIYKNLFQDKPYPGVAGSISKGLMFSLNKANTAGKDFKAEKGFNVDSIEKNQIETSFSLLFQLNSFRIKK